MERQDFFTRLCLQPKFAGFEKGRKMNMKKRVFGVLLFLLVGVATLAGCKKNDGFKVDSDKKVIKYGKAAGPYTVLFEEAVKPILEEQGYTLEAVEFSDLLQNNIALNDGEIDFNVEQHTAYCNNFNATQQGKLAAIFKVPTVPAGIFSDTHKSLDEITTGAKIVVPNDASNTARAVLLLVKAGWVTIGEDIEPSKATVNDIVDNPYDIEITEIDSSTIPNVLDEFDYAIIPGSIVYNAGIDASTVLLQEDVLDHLILQLVVREENKDTKWAKAIMDAYQSDEFKQYMEENNTGLWYLPENLQ